MLLTQDQLAEISQIIKDHHTAFVINYLSPKAVPKEVLAALKKKGLVSPKISSIEESYLLGQVAAMLEDPNTLNMTYSQLKAHLAETPIPLSDLEQHAVEFASYKAAKYVHGLGNRVDAKTGALLIEADNKLRAKLQGEIQTATAENIARRESISQLKSDLGWATDDWARDWTRIAVTEKHTAFQQGAADAYRKDYGPDVRVIRRPMGDACSYCRKLHLGPDGQPRIFKLSDLEANGTNYGKKAVDWLPVVGSIHPACQCILIRVPDGWGFNEDGEMVPGGEFGVEYKSKSDVLKAMKAEDDLQKSFKLQGSMEYQGLPIAIENKAGTYRKWKDAEGNEGQTLMPYAYGYVKRTSGQDVDEMDVFIGPNPLAPMVYIAHQQNPETGLYDEEKCMLGFSSMADARLAYLQSYDKKGPEFLQSISEMTIDQFKRWLSQTQHNKESGRSMIKKSIPLVIPLKKSLEKGYAPSTGKENPNIAAQFSRQGARNPGPGTVVNYLFRAPEKYDPPTANGYKIPLGELAEHNIEVQKRDIVKDYTVNRPNKVRPVKLVIPKDYHKGKKDEKEETRKWLQDYEKNRQSGGATNYTEIGDETIQKAKYIKRTGSPGNYKYTYARPKRTSRKKQEPVSFSSVLAKSHVTPIGGTTPKGYTVSLKHGKRQYDKSDPKEKAAKQYPKADISEFKKPNVHDQFLQKGQKVILHYHGKELKSELLGFDTRGQPIVLRNGKPSLKMIGILAGNKKRSEYVSYVSWGDIEPDGPIESYKPIYKSIDPSLVKTPSKREVKLVSQIIQTTEVAKGKVAGDYVKWLTDRGQEVYLVGGIVRDLVSGVHAKDSDDKIRDSMRDVDIITGGSPRLGLQMAAEVGLNHSSYTNNSGILESASLNNGSHIWGVVTVKDGRGLDYNTFMNGPNFNGDTPQDHDMKGDVERRDFTCNAMFYDVVNNVICDPTGKGIKDAQDRVLRIAPSLENAKKNDTLALRFWKFRLRGYKSAGPKTTLFMREMLAKAPHHALKSGLKRVLHKMKGTREERWYALRNIMKEDGAYDEYKKAIKPFKHGWLNEGILE